MFLHFVQDKYIYRKIPLKLFQIMEGYVGQFLDLMANNDIHGNTDT